MTALGTRLHMAFLALFDPVALVAFQQGGRALGRDEAERVAEIVIGQVNKPINELYREVAELRRQAVPVGGLLEEFAATTEALNELSAHLAELRRGSEVAAVERADGFGRIYALIESVVADKESAHQAIYAQIAELREALRLLHGEQLDLARRVGDLASEARTQHERLTILEETAAPKFDAPGD